jgi:Trk-type K+ transport system membrane component
MGVWATRLRRSSSNRAVEYLSTRDIYLSVTLAWTLAALLGGVPFVIEGTFSSLLDSTFEAMSGFTTTGLRYSRTSKPRRHQSSSGVA